MPPRPLDDAASDANPQGDDTTTDVNAPSDDATPGDAADDARNQSESGEGDTGAEASAEGGCGALDTPANCSACGLACGTSTGTPSCNGSTCSYACNAGHQDCNAAKAPDRDGCECAGTACCSGQCQTAHSNGKGDSFYDCVATKTHNQTQANEACAAASGACSPSSVGCNCIIILGCGSTAQSVCGSAGGKCYCWQYSGPNQGTVQESSGSNCSASCGSGSDPTWN